MLNLNFCNAAEETDFVSSLPTYAAKWLFIASALIFLAPIAVWVLRRFALWVMCKKAKVGTNRTRLGWLTALAFVGTICLKIIVSLNLENNAALNGFGHFTAIILTSFMALGGDENAVEHLTVLARVARECFGEGSCLTEFFVGYSAVLDVLAPILGCAFLFDLLLKYFPKLRLWTAVLNRHYYFSELNERSLALAESIVKKSEGWLFRPLLIFTDTYVDDESEISSELYLRARDLGAVCISDDITHVSSLSFKSKTFFLIDENEPKNLHTLAAISEGDKCLKLKNSKVYIFYQNNAYLSIETRILNKIRECFAVKYSKKIEKYIARIEKQKLVSYTGDDLENKRKKIREEARKEKEAQLIPEIERIRYYQNLIFRLLKDYPLYKHLIGRSRNGEEDFNLTILGNGEIGMQMLQSAMWCGQFYGYKLNINVVSKETKEEFCQKLNLISPEILASATPNSALLKVYVDSDDGEYNPPYFTLRYTQANVSECDLSQIDCASICGEGNNFNIIDSDYFLVALGSDEANLLVAEELRTLLDRRHVNKRHTELREGKTAVGCKTAVVAMAVFDDAVCGLFDNQPKNPDSCVEMVAFGSLSECYGWDNISMDELDFYILRNSNYYETVKKAKLTKYNRIATMYDYWSTAARTVHDKYKIFSAYNYCVDHNINWCNGKAFLLDEDDIAFYNRIIKENNALQYNLAWYEHRRWNAYIRSIGFSRMEMRKKEHKDDQNNKIISLRLHAALVESEMVKSTKDDMLDVVMVSLEDMQYKRYDYPQEYKPKEPKKERVLIRKRLFGWLAK